MSLWLRDILEDLCQRKLRDIADFEWQRFPRPYMEPELEQTVEAGSSPGPTHQLVLRCLDASVEYGWEYLGCQALPVLSLRADNYLIAFTQVQCLLM